MPRYKPSFSEHLRDYFTFTKWQRRAIALLAVVILLAAIFPLFYDAWWARKKEQASPLVIEKVNELVVRRQSDSAEVWATTETWRQPVQNKTTAAAYFPFDPNTATASQWQQLGLRPKTIQTILNYRSKGGRFRKPEDLLKIYGLPREQAEKLLPYVTIAATESSAAPVFKRDSFANRPATAKVPAQLDVNLADTSAWIALPGIGSKLANRIVAFREKLGGFYSIRQVGETYALPDSTFQKISGRLVLQSGPFRLININSASVDELKAHPYIKWNIANAIVQYRQQHGSYSSVLQLQRIAIIDEAWLEKVRPYLTVQ
jgi:competence ComEA-like helix-hairpin-helix protein